MKQSREAEYTEYVQGCLPWLRRIAYRLTQDWQLADDGSPAAWTGGGAAQPGNSLTPRARSQFPTP
jgi:hypothetical protein